MVSQVLSAQYIIYMVEERWAFQADHFQIVDNRPKFAFEILQRIKEQR
jgi:hypothetical protein